MVDYIDIVASDIALPGTPAAVFLACAIRSRGRTLSSLPASPDAEPAMTDTETAGRSLKDRTRAFEEQIINEALDRLGSKRAAAKELGVDIATIVRKTNRTAD